jgi:excisionase family DNA binding protein
VTIEPCSAENGSKSGRAEQRYNKLKRCDVAYIDGELVLGMLSLPKGQTEHIAPVSSEDIRADERDLTKWPREALIRLISEMEILELQSATTSAMARAELSRREADEDPSDESLISIKAATEFLNVSESWIDRYVRAGSIPVVRLGGLVRIRKSDLERIAKQGVKEVLGRSSISSNGNE